MWNWVAKKKTGPARQQPSCAEDNCFHHIISGLSLFFYPGSHREPHLVIPSVCLRVGSWVCHFIALSFQ